MMSGFLQSHKTWEDWIGIALGVLIGLSPSFAGHDLLGGVSLVTMLIGLLVLVLSAFELVDLHRWEEIILLVCGAVLIAMPFVAGHFGDGTLWLWHIGLGAVIALLSLFELWQDRALSDEQLAKHGQ